MNLAQLYKIGPVTNTGATYTPQKRPIKSYFPNPSESLIMGVMTSSSTSQKKIRLVHTSAQAVLRPFSRVEIIRIPTQEEEMEQAAWLKLAEASFDFWDNDEDAAYDFL